MRDAREGASTYPTWPLGQARPAYRRQQHTMLVLAASFLVSRMLGRERDVALAGSVPDGRVAPMGADGHRGHGEDRPTVPLMKREATGTGRHRDAATGAWHASSSPAVEDNIKPTGH